LKKTLERILKAVFGEGKAPSEPKTLGLKLGRSLTLPVLKCPLEKSHRPRVKI